MKPRLSDDPYGFIGSTLAERYEIEQLLGIGGMAVVYRARHLLTRRTVAVKILKPDMVFSNPLLAKYFANEAKATANLSHRNIVAVSDAAYEKDGTAFLVMEFLEGQTLDDTLREQRFMPVDRVAALFEQICDGVDHAHSRGILHRDLKPGNIMVTKDERGEELAKILDFGIAKAITETAKFSATIATISYASPEQLNKGASIDHRSDIYSLGVILYQMLTNSVPFDEESHGQLIYQKMNFILPSMRDIRPDIPAEVEDLIRRALAREPERRFRSATEMSRAFWRAINLQTGVLAVECLDAGTAGPLAGASVILNGRFSGQTGAKGEWNQGGLFPRQYLIEVDSPGYQKWRATVRIESNEEATVTVRLEREPAGELIIRTNAPAVKVDLDGKRVGETNEENLLHLESVDVGVHRLRLTHPNYKTVEAEVEISLGEITPFESELLLRSAGVRNLVTTVRGSLTQGLQRLTVGFRRLQESPQQWRPIAIILPSTVAFLLGGYLLYKHGLPYYPGRGPQTPTPVPTVTATPETAVSPTPEPETSPSPAASPSPEASLPDLLERGRQALRRGDLVQAADAFEAARQLNPNNPVTNNALRTLYPRLGDFYLNKRQYRNAANTYAKALRFEPTNSTLRERQGDAQSGLGNYAKAVEEYSAVISQGRNDALIFYKLAGAYLSQGNNTSAASFGLEAIKRNNGYREAYLLVGRALDRAGRLDDAIRVYRRATELFPNDALLLYELGTVYVEKRNFKEAQNCLRRLEYLNPELGRKLRDLIQRSQ